MENNFEFKRGAKKNAVFLSYGNHLLVSYEAYKENTTITNIVNSIIRNHFKALISPDKLEQLEGDLMKALIPDRKTLTEILWGLLKKKPRHRRPHRFREDEGLPPIPHDPKS